MDSRLRGNYKQGEGGSMELGAEATVKTLSFPRSRSWAFGPPEEDENGRSRWYAPGGYGRGGMQVDPH